jgi:glycerol-3-phosphate dehydrogenase
MTSSHSDVLIIGGGINGAGIAADAAGRGLSVVLCEQGDLAQATSSSSSKLIHGGLRYLEHYEFRLVRKALKERDVLLRAAPNLIWPLEFVLPYASHLRPAWLIRLGLYLYDGLAGKTSLPRSKRVKFTSPSLSNILKPNFTYGFQYSDCWVEDSRLVVLNALSAHQNKAQILTQTKVIAANRNDQNWEIVTENAVTKEKKHHTAKLVVNAAGPWAGEILGNTLDPLSKEKTTLALVKGSHIIVPQLYSGPQAYLLQHHDNRVIFVIPFLGKFSLIGTTDIPYHGNPLDAKIDDQEINYLCEVVNYYFDKPMKPSDVVYSYSGVRPLLDDGKSASQLTRDYKLVYDNKPQSAPLLNIFGGKITTYRQLSEEAVNSFAPYFPGLKPAWTAKATLPGGDIPHHNMKAFFDVLIQQYPWLPLTMLTRFARSYGTRIHALLAGATKLSDLGYCFGHDLYEQEVNFLINTEWARTAKDILWRRSKLELFLTTEQKHYLERWLESAEIPIYI